MVATTYPIWLTDVKDSLKAFRTADSVTKFYDTGRLSKLYFDKEGTTYLGKAGFDKAVNVALAYEQAVSVCRTDLEKGNMRLADADSQLHQLSGDAYIFARLFSLSGWAFYYYKRKQTEKAISFTLEGLNISEYLERRGHRILIYRRFEQHNNLATILFKTNRELEGATLLSGIIELLVAQQTQKLFGGGWDLQAVQHVSYISELSIDGFVSVAAKHLIEAGASGYKCTEADLFTVLFDQLPNIEATTQNRAIIYNWLYLKRAFFAGDVKIFCQGVSEFMQEDLDISFDLLKLSLLQNLLLLITKETGLINSSIHYELVSYVHQSIKLLKPFDYLKKLVTTPYSA
ncbi:hypothetical protein [Spirosoma sp.]|uniref:hypothetical protein n=1 Tax=Spirosoma sp. TaxID=1899569 RepID=UPI002601F085|nr:hypothetical protein [Spirosoma sp.]MCX6212990.1 hypothetical protein [Spirosoma sp.]